MENQVKYAIFKDLFTAASAWQIYIDEFGGLAWESNDHFDAYLVANFDAFVARVRTKPIAVLQKAAALRARLVPVLSEQDIFGLYVQEPMMERLETDGLLRQGVRQRIRQRRMAISLGYILP